MKMIEVSKWLEVSNPEQFLNSHFEMDRLEEQVLDDMLRNSTEEGEQVAASAAELRVEPEQEKVRTLVVSEKINTPEDEKAATMSASEVDEVVEIYTPPKKNSVISSSSKNKEVVDEAVEK